MAFIHRKWLGLMALIPTTGLIFMDQTILPVALPTIQKDFNASNVALEWSVNSYLLLTAMLALVGGKLGDRFGHRRILLIGLMIFIASSQLCGSSPNMTSLIGWRALQGVGAALMIPVSTPLFASLFPLHERGRATGLSAGISSLFMIAAPLLGGYLTEALSWRWIFWINLPLGLLAILLARLFLPAPAPHPTKVDAWGLSWFALCSGSAIVYFMQGREWGMLSRNSLICLALAIITLVLLVIREIKAEHPSLDLKLFKRPIYTAINISICFIHFILMVTVFRAIYFQNVLHYTPLQTGALTFLSCLPVLFISPIGGILSDRYGSNLPISLGYLLIIFSLFVLAIDPVPSLTWLLISLLAFGTGIPLIFTPSYSSAMKDVPPTKFGIAFGMIATLRTLAATMGIALLGLFLDAAQINRLSAYADQADRQTLAEISSFSMLHFGLAFLLILAFAATFVLHRRKSMHQLPETPAEGWD